MKLSLIAGVLLIIICVFGCCWAISGDDTIVMGVKLALYAVFTFLGGTLGVALIASLWPKKPRDY